MSVLESRIRLSATNLESLETSVVCSCFVHSVQAMVCVKNSEYYSSATGHPYGQRRCRLDFQSSSRDKIRKMVRNWQF